jgi:hypothetical protein
VVGGYVVGDVVVYVVGGYVVVDGTYVMHEQAELTRSTFP